jgi:hypothetical protein
VIELASICGDSDNLGAKNRSKRSGSKIPNLDLNFDQIRLIIESLSGRKKYALIILQAVLEERW